MLKLYFSTNFRGKETQFYTKVQK